jgi:CMP-2-keto-3-deoxyoctulosonic acid synthetase
VGSDNEAHFEVTEVLRETDKAILVNIEGEETWIPKSVILDQSEVYSEKNGNGTLIVKYWWAEKEGLI